MTSFPGDANAYSNVACRYVWIGTLSGTPNRALYKAYCGVLARNRGANQNEEIRFLVRMAMRIHPDESDKVSFVPIR